MSAYQDIIEATLTPDPDDLSSHFKADIVFKYRPGCSPTHDDEGREAEVEILNVLPLGVVPPMEKAALMTLADQWLRQGGGYFACCQRAEERMGDWE